MSERNHPHYVSAEEAARIVAVWEDCRSVAATADLVGRSRDAVRRHLRKAGYSEAETGKRPGRERQYDYEEIAEDYADGMTLADIRAIHGCSYDVIRKAAQANGVPLRPSGGRRSVDYEGVIADYKAGMATCLIADKYGISRSTVSYAASTAGLWRDPGEARSLAHQQLGGGS